MKKQDKTLLIETLSRQLQEVGCLYIADISNLTVETTNQLRRLCFKSNVKLIVVKNTLLKKALERIGKDFSELYPVLNGPSAIMTAEASNVPAKLIKEFRRNNPKPILKAAYVEETVYTGDDQLNALINIKSKNELIADLVALLMSPAKNVVSALQSGGNTIAGVLKTLSEKEKAA
ncbi:MAG TPA: 50S ribosomal protein L10 [Bacteroidales bacterium]|nr:50S ribosomal protein L10 [Bacteroidales bacterium]